MNAKRLERKGWNWAPIPAEVILSQKLTHADIRVYAYLLWRAGSKERAWPKTETIAKELSMSDGAVRVCFRNLVSENWIRRLRRLGQSSMTYIFETQKDCLEFSPSSILLDDVRLTGETTYSQQDRRVNKSHKNKNQEELRASARADLRELDHLFTELTGLPIPTGITYKEKRADAAAWYQPMRRMQTLANGSAADTLRATVQQMRKDGLTISAPRSVENVFKAVYALKVSPIFKPIKVYE